LEDVGLDVNDDAGLAVGVGGAVVEDYKIVETNILFIRMESRVEKRWLVD
jgi:hypothetical protein